jgi:hypothetical protein
MCLQLFAGLEADRLARGNGHFFAGSWVSAYATLSWLNNKNAKAAQLNSLTSRERCLHRVEKGIHSLFGFHLRNAGLIRHTVDDV